jgi:glyceraldehyde-3-phosphate dehydrogenase/erythrose-4-phosphate dehydrogenase
VWDPTLFRRPLEQHQPFSSFCPSLPESSLVSASIPSPGAPTDLAPLIGISIRVPVNNVSMVDLTVSLKTPVASKADLLFPLRQAAAGKSRYTIGPLNEVIAVDDNELVSSDFLGWKQSCIVDAAATVMLNPTTAKIIAFYDNEWA